MSLKYFLLTAWIGAFVFICTEAHIDTRLPRIENGISLYPNSPSVEQMAEHWLQSHLNQSFKFQKDENGDLYNSLDNIKVLRDSIPIGNSYLLKKYCVISNTDRICMEVGLNPGVNDYPSKIRIRAHPKKMMKKTLGPDWQGESFEEEIKTLESKLNGFLTNENNKFFNNEGKSVSLKRKRSAENVHELPQAEHSSLYSSDSLYSRGEEEAPDRYQKTDKLKYFQLPVQPWIPSKNEGSHEKIELNKQIGEMMKSDSMKLSGRRNLMRTLEKNQEMDRNEAKIKDMNENGSLYTNREIKINDKPETNENKDSNLNTRGNLKMEENREITLNKDTVDGRRDGNRKIKINSGMEINISKKKNEGNGRNKTMEIIGNVNSSTQKINEGGKKETNNFKSMEMNGGIGINGNIEGNWALVKPGNGENNQENYKNGMIFMNKEMVKNGRMKINGFMEASGNERKSEQMEINKEKGKYGSKKGNGEIIRNEEAETGYRGIEVNRVMGESNGMDRSRLLLIDRGMSEGVRNGPIERDGGVKIYGGIGPNGNSGRSEQIIKNQEVARSGSMKESTKMFENGGAEKGYGGMEVSRGMRGSGQTDRNIETVNNRGMLEGVSRGGSEAMEKEGNMKMNGKMRTNGNKEMLINGRTKESNEIMEYGEVEGKENIGIYEDRGGRGQLNRNIGVINNRDMLEGINRDRNGAMEIDVGGKINGGIVTNENIRDEQMEKNKAMLRKGSEKENSELRGNGEVVKGNRGIGESGQMDSNKRIINNKDILEGRIRDGNEAIISDGRMNVILGIGSNRNIENEQMEKNKGIVRNRSMKGNSEMGENEEVKSSEKIKGNGVFKVNRGMGGNEQMDRNRGILQNRGMSEGQSSGGNRETKNDKGMEINGGLKTNKNMTENGAVERSETMRRNLGIGGIGEMKRNDDNGMKKDMNGEMDRNSDMKLNSETGVNGSMRRDWSLDLRRDMGLNVEKSGIRGPMETNRNMELNHGMSLNRNIKRNSSITARGGMGQDKAMELNRGMGWKIEMEANGDKKKINIDQRERIYPIWGRKKRDADYYEANSQQADDDTVQVSGQSMEGDADNQEAEASNQESDSDNHEEGSRNSGGKTNKKKLSKKSHKNVSKVKKSHKNVSKVKKSHSNVHNKPVKKIPDYSNDQSDKSVSGESADNEVSEKSSEKAVQEPEGEVSEETFKGSDADDNNKNEESYKESNNFDLSDSHYDWRRCKLPKEAKNAEILCKKWNTAIVCNLYCIFGHRFPEGIRRTTTCRFDEGVWSKKFDECKPFVDCSVQLVGAGKLSCTTHKLKAGNECRISCDRNGKNSHTRTYVCTNEGRWTPSLPRCVQREGLELLDIPSVLSHHRIAYPDKYPS